LVAVIRFVVRLLLVLLLAVLLGAGVYFGLPALYRRYVQPIETNLARLDDAQARQEQTDQQLRQRLDDLQRRLEALELQNDTQKQSLDEIQTSLSGLEKTAQSAQDENLLTRLGEVESALQAANANLDQLRNDLAGVNQAQAQNSLLVQDLARKAETGSLETELQLLKAMELLTRSRLSLVENNAGEAEQDVRAARQLLADLGGEVPEYQVEALSSIIARLDQALTDLPARPVLAADNLEIAWQLLRSGLPGEPTPEPTLTPGTPTGTPTPGPAP
jgi:chromosome segregation ATPase